MTLQESEQRVDLLQSECSTCLLFQNCELFEAIGDEPEEEHPILNKFIEETGLCRLKERINKLTISDIHEYALVNDLMD